MKFYRNTVSDLLFDTLVKLMKFEQLKSFRLVGGTSLSLLLGHRVSVDIDLFTDAIYDSIDFNEIDKLLLEKFPVVEMGYGGNNSMGKSYFIGESIDELIKLDLFYTDPFAYTSVEFEEIRLSTLEEITAMKLEVIGNNGRKKDFWDLHELFNHFSLTEMLSFYEKRYPYSNTKEEIINKLLYFDQADTDFDPICLKNKTWQLIKLDIEDILKTEKNI